MEYGGYLAIAALVSAGVCFVLAIFYRTKPRSFELSLKFTGLGFSILVALGLVVLGFGDSGYLGISVLLFIALACIYYWLYKNVRKWEQ